MGDLFQIQQKRHGFRYTVVYKTAVFVEAKHLKVLKTLVYEKAVVFSKYFKKTEQPNAALMYDQLVICIEPKNYPSIS